MLKNKNNITNHNNSYITNFKMVKKVQILDTPGCPSCIVAEKIINSIKEENNLDYEIEVIDVTKNPEILQKYQIMAAPGIVIDGELFSTGHPNEEKLRKALTK